VYAECLNPCFILEIEEDNLVSIVNQDQKVQKKLLTYQNELLKSNLVYALDYVVIIPRDIMDKHYKQKNLTLESFRRMTRMKNVVMRRVLEIRQEKTKPKLSDLLSELTVPDKNEETGVAYTKEEKDKLKKQKREKLANKLKDLYESGDKGAVELSEIEVIQRSIKTIKNKTEAQWEIIASLDDQINILKDHREEKDMKNL